VRISNSCFTFAVFFFFLIFAFVRQGLYLGFGLSYYIRSQEFWVRVSENGRHSKLRICSSLGGCDYSGGSWSNSSSRGACGISQSDNGARRCFNALPSLPILRSHRLLHPFLLGYPILLRSFPARFPDQGKEAIIFFLYLTYSCIHHHGYRFCGGYSFLDESQSIVYRANGFLTLFSHLDNKGFFTVLVIVYSWN